MDYNVIGALAGGLGLFLLGMRLMTDGLRLAAGKALRTILSKWTKTPMRGVLAGFSITALVQSSSAVTVAVIGFVNAGLLSLYQTVWVIFGSNVGTTITGWLVALVGFKVDIKIVALPLIGLGMIMNISGHAGQKRAAIGEALAGFGIFFLGIEILKTAFSGIGALPPWLANVEGLAGLPILLGVGFALTVLMQSSSAAMALVITAASQGMIGLAGASAMVIGANLGTTSTAALAVIGATSNAKRIAAAHVIFNVLTGVAALALLPVLVPAIVEGREYLDLGPSISETLATFHTIFNILGVVIMWPITRLMTNWLQRCFRTQEEELGRARYLDKAVAKTPALAMDALGLELGRVGFLVQDMILELGKETPEKEVVTSRYHALERLSAAISQFVALLQQYNLAEQLGSAMPLSLQVAQYYQNAADAAENAMELRVQQEALTDAPLREIMAEFQDNLIEAAYACPPCRENYDPELASEKQEAVTGSYHTLKAELLKAGAAGRISMADMANRLEACSSLKRMIKQFAKGAAYLNKLPEYVNTCPMK